MSQEEIVRYIMKGLRATITRYLGVMDNFTLKQLKDNIRNYEMVEFMVIGETIQSPIYIYKIQLYMTK